MLIYKKNNFEILYLICKRYLGRIFKKRGHNMKKQINIERLKNTINKSAEIGKIPGNGLRRLALTDEDKAMRDLFLSWMQEANLETRIDDLGNMYGRREGKEDLSPIVIGSHLDTQPNG